MLATIWACFLASLRFRDYRPQPITKRSVRRWLSQFERQDQKALRALLRNVIYLSEHSVRNELVELNESLLERLELAGVSTKKVVYIQVGDAGSSSPVILNMLRDAALLERRGCTFLDSKDVKGIHDTTNKLEEGAIVYVDDFLGSGNQFYASRSSFADYIIGNFVEFSLAPCICEEAVTRLNELGVEPKTSRIHYTRERPLHEGSNLLPTDTKTRLRELSFQMDRKGGLGYRSMATMVVLYRNAPTNVPLLLRGNLGQRPRVGVFPRTTDLPTEKPRLATQP